MIVRISGEGQWRMSSAHLATLNVLDNELVEMIAGCDEGTFQARLDQMLSYVRENGEPIPPDLLVESNIILPPADTTVDEARALFVGEGLLPG